MPFVRDTSSSRSRASRQGTRWDRSCSPLGYSLLRDLASTLGQTDSSWLTSKAFILIPDDLALEQTLLYFDERWRFIRLCQAKCEMLAIEDTQTNGLKMLGTCIEEILVPPADRNRTK